MEYGVWNVQTDRKSTVSCVIYCIAGKFGELTRFEHLRKESLVNYRSANRLLIVGTNLDGFSMATHRRFTKLSPAKFSRYTVSMFF